MFSMLTHCYRPSGLEFIEGYGNRMVRRVLVYGESLYCVYDNWDIDLHDNFDEAYTIVRYLSGITDLGIYREWLNSNRILIPTALSFSRVL